MAAFRWVDVPRFDAREGGLELPARVVAVALRGTPFATPQFKLKKHNHFFNPKLAQQNDYG